MSYARRPSRDESSLSCGSPTCSVAPEATSATSSHSPDAAAAAAAETSDQDQDSINVVVRVRPLNRQEVERKDSLAVQFPGDGVLWCETNGSLKPFAFNVLFEPEASQQDVFEHSGVKKLVSMATEGFACTCFAFGQTGSGKTHTITGPPQQFQNGKALQEDGYGLIQMSFIYLCELVDNQRKSGITCTVTASYFELYNEQVIDLLNARSGRKLNVRWSKEKGFHVENVFTVQCENLVDLMGVLEEGLQNRSTTAHNMNELSSRSHSMLVLSIESEMPDPEDENLFLTKQGKLTFVDLAGSEKVKDTSTTGSQLLETNNINRSLLVLGKCISALGNPKKRSGHIPYRDSKLTKLLADGIGGSGVTLMVACVSPSSSNVAETMNTLRYATRAKRIRNQPVVRMDPREKLIMGMKKEIHLLRMENEYLREQLQFPRSSPNVAKTSLSPGAAAGGSATHAYAKGSPRGGEPVGASAPRRPANRAAAAQSQPSRSAAAGASPSDKSLSDESVLRRERSDHRADATAERHTIAESVAAAVAAATAASSPPPSENQSDLYDMLKEYMVENEALRTENADMQQHGSRLKRDQQVLFRENDRLRHKIEDIERFLLSGGGGGGDNRVFMYGSGGYPAGGWPWYEPAIYATHSGLSSASSQASRYTQVSSRSDANGSGTPYTVPTSPVASQFIGQGQRAGPPSFDPRWQRHGQQPRAYRLVHLTPPSKTPSQTPPSPKLLQQPSDGQQQQQTSGGSGSGKPPLPATSLASSYASIQARPGAQQRAKHVPAAKERSPPLRVVYGADEERGRGHHDLSRADFENFGSGFASNESSRLQYAPSRSDPSAVDATGGERSPPPASSYAAAVNERLKRELLELDGEIRSAQKAIQNSG